MQNKKKVIYNFKFPSLALVSLWLSGRILGWRLSQPGFDPSFGNLACLTTLKSYDTVDDNIYIYIYSHIHFHV